MSDRKVSVDADRGRCVSNRRCTQVAPAVFTTGEDGKVEVGDPDRAPVDDILEAAFSCPVGAISLTDVETGADLLG